MTAKVFGVLGVTAADGRLAGMVTDGDLRRYLTSGRTAQTIDEVMTVSPITATPVTLAAEVLRTLNEKKTTQHFGLDLDGAYARTHGRQATGDETGAATDHQRTHARHRPQRLEESSDNLGRQHVLSG